jgi:hypothetical protein
MHLPTLTPSRTSPEPIRAAMLAAACPVARGQHAVGVLGMLLAIHGLLAVGLAFYVGLVGWTLVGMGPLIFLVGVSLGKRALRPPRTPSRR